MPSPDLIYSVTCPMAGWIACRAGHPAGANRPSPYGVGVGVRGIFAVCYCSVYCGHGSLALKSGEGLTIKVLWLLRMTCEGCCLHGGCCMCCIVCLLLSRPVVVSTSGKVGESCRWRNPALAKSCKPYVPSQEVGGFTPGLEAMSLSVLDARDNAH